MTRTLTIKIRKCGRRVKGGLYLIGGGEASEDGTLMFFNEINPPIPYQVPVHRGPRLVEANAVLARKPMETWWYGASKDTEEKKLADQWSLQTFGMTLSSRLNIGVTADAKTAQEAVAILVNRIKPLGSSRRIIDHFRKLTIEKVQELPRVAEHYNRLHENLYEYFEKRTVNYLINVQASIWQIAFNLPPTRRTGVVEILAGFLALLNLGEDGMALYRLFKEKNNAT